MEQITIQQAINLLHENVKSPSLIKHCKAVGFAMRAYAQHFNLTKEEQEKWEITGILHDFDYEKFPSLDKHPYEGIKILKQLNYPEEIIKAILSHGDHTNTPRVTLMEKTLFAVDELCGFILALAYVRPLNFNGMSSESVKKALKKKGFAEKISRNDIEKGIEELQIEPSTHLEIVIKALTNNVKEFGF